MGTHCNSVKNKDESLVNRGGTNPQNKNKNTEIIIDK